MHPAGSEWATSTHWLSCPGDVVMNGEKMNLWEFWNIMLMLGVGIQDGFAQSNL